MGGRLGDVRGVRGDDSRGSVSASFRCCLRRSKFTGTSGCRKRATGAVAWPFESYLGFLMNEGFLRTKRFDSSSGASSDKTDVIGLFLDDLVLGWETAEGVLVGLEDLEVFVATTVFPTVGGSFFRGIVSAGYRVPTRHVYRRTYSLSISSLAFQYLKLGQSH